MSARYLVHAVWLVVLSACTHPIAAPRSPSCPPAPALRAPAAADAAERAPTLEPPPRKLTWRLRVSDAAPWVDVPTALHAFSLPRWECALGEVQTDGATTDSQVLLAPTRRLACTHSSGITVQTRLDCPLQDAKPAALRELELSLDTLPTLRVACEAVPVERSAPTPIRTP